jgi:HSP20 family protein
MTFVRFKQRPALSTLNNFIDSALPSFPSLYGSEFPGLQHSVPVNIRQMEKEFVLEIVAPGYSKEQLSIHIEKDTLTVTGEKGKEEENENGRMIRKEYLAKGFKKSFTLPESAEGANISAQYVNGVLTLNLPLKQEVKEETKQITIQ